MLLQYFCACLAFISVSRGLNVQPYVDGDGGDVDKPAEQGRSLTLGCDVQGGSSSDSWLACMITKSIDGEFTESGQDEHFSCMVTPGQSSASCQASSTDLQQAIDGIQAVSTSSKCGLQVSNALPHHSGEWTCSVRDINDAATAQRWNAFVSNQSEIVISDPDMAHDDSQTIVYDLSKSRPRIEATCTAWGGSPEPTFHWYVDDDNNEITDADIDTDVFKGGAESSISFEPTLEDLCRDYDIEKACDLVNNDQDWDDYPSSTINFNLICKVEQISGNGRLYFQSENDRKFAEVLVEVSAATQLTNLSITLTVVATLFSKVLAKF